MSLRHGANRDRLSCSMGLARPFQCDPAGARFRLCDLCRQLAQPVSGDQGAGGNHALSGRGHRDGKELLCPMRNAAHVRTGALGAHGQHTARALQQPHGAGTPLPRCHRRAAGLGISGRAARSPEGLSRNRVGTPGSERGAEEAARDHRPTLTAKASGGVQTLSQNVQIYETSGRDLQGTELPAALVLPASGALARASGDAAYCKALADKYSLLIGGTNRPEPLGGKEARHGLRQPHRGGNRWPTQRNRRGMSEAPE